MTRILHVLDHSLPMHSGYTFRTRAILKAQRALGWEVLGVTGRRHTAEGPAIEECDDLRFVRTSGKSRIPGPFRELADIHAQSRTIEAAVREFRPDVIHVHSPVLNALAAQRVAARHNIPLLYEIRAFWEDASVGNGTGREGSLRYRLTRWLETRAVRKADAVAVICEGLRRDLVARGIRPAKIMVSPNGVDLDLFGNPGPRDDALAEELGLAGADVVGFIGSFYDYEGLDDLIAAMPALMERRPNAHLLLVGGGPMEAALKAQAAASPAAPRIHFVGRVPHDAVERYYGLIDILAYPRKAMRLTELVTPLKPLEAMAQGRLVAASSVGGHRELIHDGITGSLFAPDSPPAIAESLGRLFGNRAGWAERRSTARDFVAAKRDWASNIARYQPVYQRLLARGPAAPVPENRPAVLAAIGAGIAAAVMLSLPVGWLELGAAATGLSELVPAAAPPLGVTARALLAGMAAVLVGATILAVTRPGKEGQGDRKMAFAFAKLTAFARGGRSRLGANGRDGVLARRTADLHPDAPPRRPIFASEDFAGTDFAPPPVPAIRAEEPVGRSLRMPQSPAPLDDIEVAAHLAQPEAQAEPVEKVMAVMPMSFSAAAFDPVEADATAVNADTIPATASPEAEPAPANAGGMLVADQRIAAITPVASLENLSLEALAARFERGLSERQPTLPQTGYRPMTLAEMPAAAPVPVREAVDEDIESALQAALGTLHKMTARR